MSKILIITNHSYMLYRLRLELIRELMKHHEVVLSMPFVGHEEDFQALGLRCIDTPVDRRGINPKTDLKLFCKYRKLLKQEKPDLVITYSIKPNIYAGIACTMAKIPFCANVQGLGTAFQRKGVAWIATLLYKAAFRKVRTVFFENVGNAEEFCERTGVPSDRCTILSGAGINLEKYPCQAYPANPIPRFLYLGRIMKEKGMDELFAATERLHSEGEHFILDMVGFFEDGYKDQVEELQRLGILQFHGFQQEPRPFYGAADCVVLPSYHEGMSNVLLEGAAIGRPVITSRIHGCMEAVVEGESGYLCEVKNADSLYEAMKCILRTSPSERAAMGLRGRRHMEENFEKGKVVQETIKNLNIC